MLSKFKIPAITALVVTLGAAMIFASAEKPSAGKQILPGKCETCHVNSIPTPSDSALRKCPVYHPPKVSPENMLRPEDGPRMLALDKIDGKYAPVKFDHLKHASHAQMQNGCWTCHHHSSPNKPIPSCASCHKQELVREDLKVPTLKAAYHQQCLDCHKGWTGDTSCAGCHVSKGQKPAANIYQSPKSSEKYVYSVPKYSNTKVTFFHNSHVGFYGLNCNDCHAGASCAACHDVKRVAGEKKGEPVAKANHDADSCFKCHANAACDKCHKDKEVEGGAFDHAKTGFPLKKYHAKLSCDSCHKGGFDKKISRKCSACHGKWSADNFNHAKSAGVKLGDVHGSFDCGDCHVGGFDKKVECESCHEGITYPAMKPDM